MEDQGSPCYGIIVVRRSQFRNEILVVFRSVLSLRVRPSPTRAQSRVPNIAK